MDADPKAGWNPKSSSELFLGLLPYLLVFVIVPICLLLVCWCSKYLIRLCSRKLSNTARTGILARLCPRSQTSGIPSNRPNGRGVDENNVPATLFTNYTNYNPILEGELDLFPISYTPQSGEVALPSNPNRPQQQQAQRGLDCAHSLYMDLSMIPFADFGSVRESRLHDPPPRYPEDPPPSYESLFCNNGEPLNKDDADSKETISGVMLN